MAAGRADSVDGDQHPRPHGDAGVDGVPQPHVHVIPGADVAHRGEAGIQSSLGVAGGVQRLLRRKAEAVVVESLVVVVLELEGEVDVGIDEARQEGRVAEIDHPRTRRHRDAVAGRGDRAALDHHDAVVDQPAGDTVEQVGRLQDDRRLRLPELAGRLGGERDGDEREQRAEGDGEGRSRRAAVGHGSSWEAGPFAWNAWDGGWVRRSGVDGRSRRLARQGRPIMSHEGPARGTIAMPSIDRGRSAGRRSRGAFGSSVATSSSSCGIVDD